MIKFKEFFFVPECIICGEAMRIGDNGLNICKDCLSEFKFINSSYCPDCRGPISDKKRHDCPRNKSMHFCFEYAIAVCEYKDRIKTAHHIFKFHDTPSYGKTIANLIINKIDALPFPIYADLVIPVPLGKKRFIERGYNQAGILAEHIARELNIEFCDDIIKRIKETGPQHSKSNFQRRLNISGAFEVSDRTRLAGKTVLVIDDVFSTGNTANEFAGTLIKGGARSVIMATFAATPYINEKKPKQALSKNATAPDVSDEEVINLAKICPSPIFEMRKNK